MRVADGEGGGAGARQRGGVWRWRLPAACGRGPIGPDFVRATSPRAGKKAGVLLRLVAEGRVPLVRVPGEKGSLP